MLNLSLNRLPKSLSLLFILVPLLVISEGCKLQITAPSNGAIVSSSGNNDCATGEICEIEISALDFADTFTAQADEGFVFDGWLGSANHLCGGSTAPCVLSLLSVAAFDGAQDLGLAALYSAALAIVADPDQTYFLQAVFSLQSESQQCSNDTDSACSDSSEVCIFPTNTCSVTDNAGVCTARPDACTAQFDPVCGCDGETYSNECAATVAGVSVDHIGACADTTGQCSNNGELACSDSNEVCIYPVNTCNVTDNTGACTTRSDVCTLQFDPVCGCDGETYSNECAAISAGISIDHIGSCTDTTGQCSTSGELTCSDSTDVCIYPTNTCSVTDNIGVCTTPSEVCTLEFDPVCGCDGETYSNECAAIAAGVSVDTTGACEPVAEPAAGTCGGIAGLQCADSSAVCIFSENTCQVADNLGVCTTPSEFCTLEFDPVCGCDGVTYSNACAATRAGASIDSQGSCATAI